MPLLLKILGGLVIAGLVPVVAASVRRLNRRIDEHFAEEEQATGDPYAQMAKLLQPDRPAKPKKRPGAKG